MNKLLPICAAILALSSCATTFRQVVTVASTQASPSENGNLCFDEDGLSLTYDFWAENGVVSFVATNNTAEDVYVDLTRSFLVVNGMTFDYYRNRTYSSKVSNSYSETVASASGVDTFSAASSQASMSSGSSGSTMGSGLSQVLAYATKKNSSAYVSNSVETKEAEGVWIPAHASRYFCEFSLLTAPYRVCGLPRDPSRRDNASIDYDAENSPFLFENRLHVVAGGKEGIVSNSFYISNFTNVRKDDAVEETRIYDCNGKRASEKGTFNIHEAGNRFYVDYRFSGSNDRIK